MLGNESQHLIILVSVMNPFGVTLHKNGAQGFAIHFQRNSDAIDIISTDQFDFMLFCQFFDLASAVFNKISRADNVTCRSVKIL